MTTTSILSRRTLVASAAALTACFQSGRVMSDILIQCPVLGKPVATGLRTEAIRFSSLPDEPYSLRCPACRKMHDWKPKDAWVGQQE
jgi:hypothetical protein